MTRALASALSLGRSSEQTAIKRWRTSYLLSNPNGRFDQSRPDQGQYAEHPHRRAFSSSRVWGKGRSGAVKPSIKMASQPALSSQMKSAQAEALRAGIIPEDVGLLPDTIIMPRGENLPSLFAKPLERWKLERKRAKVRMTDMLAQVMYWLFTKPRRPNRIRLIPPVATELYEEMYLGLAMGNLDLVQDRLCPGIAASLKSRIQSRTPNTSYRWRLHKFISRPKVVSYKVAPQMQKGDYAVHLAVIQCVVRMHTLQSLQRILRVTVRHPKTREMVTQERLVDAQGNELPEAASEQQVAVPKGAREKVEYLVVQRQLKNDELGPWKVWGTAQETSLRMLERAEKKGADPVYG